MEVIHLSSVKFDIDLWSFTKRNCSYAILKVENHFLIFKIFICTKKEMKILRKLRYYVLVYTEKVFNEATSTENEKAIKVLPPVAVHGFRKRCMCRFVSTCAKLFPFAAEISLRSGFSTTASEPQMAPFAPNGDHALT